jgi:hypothetical protein
VRRIPNSHADTGYTDAGHRVPGPSPYASHQHTAHRPAASYAESAHSQSRKVLSSTGAQPGYEDAPHRFSGPHAEPAYCEAMQVIARPQSKGTYRNARERLGGPNPRSDRQPVDACASRNRHPESKATHGTSRLVVRRTPQRHIDAAHPLHLAVSVIEAKPCGAFRVANAQADSASRQIQSLVALRRSLWNGDKK